MNKLYRLNFIVVVLIAYLSPWVGFTSSIYQGSSNITGSYITIKYQPSISNFRNFHIKETDFDTSEPIGLKTSVRNIENSTLNTYHNFYASEESDSYKSYGNDLLGFGASIGLLAKNLRVEFEGSYKRFDIKHFVNYVARDGDRYFSIPRQTALSVTPMGGENMTFIADSTTCLGYTVAKNTGITIASNMINLCYDLIKHNNFTPYVCLGIGGNFIEVFDSMRIKFAYQGRVGISYPITSKLILSISGQYHKVVGNKFKLLPLNQPVPLRRVSKGQEEQDVTALLTLDLGYFSGDIGLSFMF